jgi:HPr kinase/phosphorylase
MLALGAQLVSDDRVWLRASTTGLRLQAPQAVAGRVEARGLGLLSCAHTPEASLKFCLDLSQTCDRRLPFVQEVTRLGHSVSVIPGGPQVPRAAAFMLLLQNGFAADD